MKFYHFPSSPNSRRVLLELPVVADADTGHGDLHNVMRCVREFEGAGAAGGA